ncbi:MAG: tetratricopeptide repeat protein, partial [Myxococcota bacterium]
LASALEALVQTVRAPRERLALLRRIGELHAQRTDRPERAIHWYEAALGVDPADAPALQALTPLYEATESWEELARMLLQAATRTGDPATRAAAHARIAELKETRLGDKDAAIEHHTKALSALPGHAASFKALTRLFGEAGRHRELLELYERAADEADEATVAVSHLFKVGALYEDALGEPAQATHAYRRILDLDRGNLSAIHALQRAAERAGRHPELVEAIELEVARVEETPRVVALLHRAGEILEMRLRDKEGALQRYRRALERDASYRPALESLGRLYHATGRWEDLLETCGRELALDPGRERTLTLLHTMGQLCADRLGREEEGLAYFWRALELDAEDGPALQALTRRLAEGDDAEALTRALEAELAARDDPRARGRAALRLGEVRESRSGDLEAAEQAYAEARAEAPELVPARTSLRRVRAARGSWEAVALDLAEEALEATEAGDEARAAALRLEEGVVLADRLRQPARAIAAFEAARDLDATSLAPLLSLEELYRATRAWSDLAATHARVAELAEEPGQRIAALRAQLRVVEAHELADSPRSARALEEAIVVLDPSDRGALVSLEARALAELATADAGTEGPILRRLLDVERRLGRLGGPADLRAHHVTRAAEAAEALGERDTALALFRDALTLDGGSFAATRGLSRVAEAEDDPVLLAEAARREAEIAADAAAAARLLLRSAMVRTERLGDRSGAEADLERALELDAGSETASQMLIELLEARGAYERLGDVLTRAAGASEGDRSAALWAEVARLQAGPLGNLAAAIASLQRVLRDAPNHVPTLRALADLYTRDDQPAEASRLLGRIVKLAPPRRVLKDAHLGLAELWLGPLGDAQRALVSLQAVLAIDPADARALEQLAELHEHAGRLGDAREAAERLLASSEGAARAAALLRLGRLRDAEGDDAAALEAYAEGVALEGPGSESALELKALAMGPAAFESYVAALRRYLMRDDAREHVGALLEIARVLGDSLARPRAAIEVLEEGVASHPKELRLRRELGLRLRDAGDAEHAASAFEALASADPRRPYGWRELSRTHLAMERRVEARIAAEPLAVLGVP